MADRKKLKKSSDRKKLKKEEETESKQGGNYFAEPKDNIDFIHSGCALLDCVLGGGYPLGRIVNVVGDKSTGKTLLAIEACANFHRQYPHGKMWYREAEAAFDPEYAAALGMPTEYIDFNDDESNPIHTVEDLFRDMLDCIKNTDDDTPGLYIIDSLDALSDSDEMQRDMEKGSYGTGKSKRMSELFRRHVRDLEKKNITVIFISQVRDNIGAMFGEKHTRSGGRALDFYASQALWLSYTGPETITKRKTKRVTGVNIKAKCKKNKISLPMRECEFKILFGYGVDDLRANLDWLAQVGALDEVGLTQTWHKSMKKELAKLDNDEYDDLAKKADESVRRVWTEIENDILPTRRKY